MKVGSATNMGGKKRRNLQDYFDLNYNHIVTPNQRSLPKYKNMFNHPKQNKSNKKDHIAPKRHSVGRVEAKKQKIQLSPPHKANRSNQKYTRFEHSINR